MSGNDLALTAWVQADQLENCLHNDCRILSKSTGTAEQDHYWMLSTIKVGDQTRLRFRLKTNGSTSTLIASSGDLTNAEFFHVAAVYDGTTMRLYKNGIEVGSLEKSGNIDTNASVETWIGGNPPDTSSRPWDGRIADVRVYGNALTIEEVNRVKNSYTIMDAWVTYQYKGEIISVDSPLTETFSIGDTFTGTYTFDSAIPANPDNTPPFSPGRGFFQDTIRAASFTSGNYSAAGTSGAFLNQFFENIGDSSQVIGEKNEYSTSFHMDAPRIGDRGFAPGQLTLSWVFIDDGRWDFLPDTADPKKLLVSPRFEPNVPPYEVLPDFVLFDSDGDVIYTPTEGVIGDFSNQPLFTEGGFPVFNGEFSLDFFGQFSQDPSDPVAPNEEAKLRGKLKSVILVSGNNIPLLTVANNTWLQIGLNTAPPAGSTVANIIGDDISAPYDTDWVLYSYETSTNTYKKLALTDSMLPGVGYWFIQTTGNSVTINMPDASAAVNVAHHPACTSIAGGCFEILLQTNPIDAQWQMIGYPFREPRNIDKLRIVTNAGDCRIGCTLSQAQAEGLVGDTLWHFDGNSYQQLTDDGSKYFKPWDGAWLATLPAAREMTLKLLIPAAN